MRLGILGTIQLAGTVVFAAPVGIFGLTRLTEGDAVLGGGLAAVAVAMVALPHYLTTPGEIPMQIAERVIGRAVVTPDDEEDPE
ncbi:hypothetical protein GCM10008995_01460 [Halobellus salinus]|uniref:Uncharacterized protein n=1 Tax=Halobellus salinus TaxID=931585 RepID=A0A830E6T0_9EURY|nr:hypothetical protein [Halobellus salinus]GGI94936.1 hypothetical protein GCM10008995_01460 [Halobellus salinus]SMP20443.1 hypothetical protein SAMN06265347_107151 [Halobellus salinus]